MSEQLGLGKIITTPQSRDAVHIAVVPVVAPIRLFAGQRVNAKGYPTTKGVGIVDPYLEMPVKQGETFWLFLLPGSVTSLRHVWTSPDFPGE